MLFCWGQDRWAKAPFEIKAKSYPTRNDTRGLQAFRSAYPHLTIEKGLILCPGTTSYAVTEFDDVLPWDVR